ncbi:MAG: hypothetical protein ACE15D_04020 [Candidatus Eisenbacteria bacterium]
MASAAAIAATAAAALVLCLAGCGADGGKKLTAPPGDGEPDPNGGDVTFTEQVHPVMERSCSCHQPGGIMYPQVPLDTYARAYARRSAIRLKVWEQRAMPPGGGLTEDERALFRDWVDAGAPE